MTENTTYPSNVMEDVEPLQPAVGGGSQAKEGIGLTTAKKKKKLTANHCHTQAYTLPHTAARTVAQK
jgi:hypothetical protein